MTTELITGHEGTAHVSSADVGQYNSGVIGSGRYVLDTGAQLACEVISANQVSIGTGDAIFDGRHVRVSAAQTVSIDNGAQGVNRHDIVCFKYEYNAGTDVESVSLAVVKGTAAATATDPTIPSGNILESANVAYMPLWRIVIEGITVGEPQKLFGDVLVSLDEMMTHVWDAAQIPNISAEKVTSGTLDVARIPNLDAGKIASGTFADARIPNLAAGKITSGTFAADRIPNLPAAKITSGTFDVARIPNMSAAKITSGTLPVSRGGTGKTAGTCYMATVLYGWNSSGATGNVTLSDNVENYTFIEVFYSTGDGEQSSVKVYRNTSYISLDIMHLNGSNWYFGTKRVKVSGNTLSLVSVSGTSGGFARITGDGGVYVSSDSTSVKINMVVGYK